MSELKSQPTSEEVRLLRQAIGDPGSFTGRADGFAETITSWSHRAVMLSGWLSPSQVAAEIAAALDSTPTPCENRGPQIIDDPRYGEVWDCDGGKTCSCPPAGGEDA